ncbi:major facilitator superfamily domain-containing protein [Aspergillus pseudodeflectus]|uniref:Major facilitator superfamily domain-containing protein n=1 Tax=Aspergillus pseudodeflectus TaxID=176178 RepID=A0ABR4JT95_9EURO
MSSGLQQQPSLSGQSEEKPDQNEDPGLDDDGAITFNPGVPFYMAFSSLVVLAMMVSLDGTSVSVALPLIAESLRGSAIEAFWTGTSFLLSSAVFQPPLAALSHIFGRMPVLTVCIVFFLVGVIVSSVASTFTPMIVGRTVQGVGGGGIILMSDIIITDLVPMRLRGTYFGIIGGVWALGSVTGPVIGGVLASQASWRWIFWILIPFAATSLVIVPLFMKLNLVKGTIAEKLRRIDWLGTVWFIAATTSFLIPVSWGGVQYPWDSWRTLVPLIVGVVGFAGFIVYENYVPPEPTFRLHLLRSYNMAYSIYATLINAMIVYGLIYFLPLYFEATKGYNPIITGVALFPATLTVAPASIISGAIITKTGDFKIITCIAWIITTLGLGVMILLDVDTTIPQWIFLTLCTGIGLGILYTSLAFVNQAASDDASMAFAVSFFIFARLIGQCIGVAICGVIFQNQMRAKLLAIPSLADQADEYSRDASSLVTELREMGDPVKKAHLISAYAESLQIAWTVMCALSGSAMIGSFFVRKISLDRALKTEQGLRDVDRLGPSSP